MRPPFSSYILLIRTLTHAEARPESLAPFKLRRRKKRPRQLRQRDNRTVCRVEMLPFCLSRISLSCLTKAAVPLKSLRVALLLTQKVIDANDFSHLIPPLLVALLVVKPYVAGAVNLVYNTGMKLPSLPHGYIKPLFMGVLIGFVPMLLVWSYWLYSQSSEVRCELDHPFTSKSIGCAQYAESTDRIKQLDASLDDAVQTYVTAGKATRISVWTRDLETTQWASTNETERYEPASLFKVPLMIAYYKFSQLDPTLFSTKLKFEPSAQLNSDNQFYKPSQKLVAGQSYTVDELITDMITNSDNDAAAVLLENIDPALVTQTAVDLGIAIPGKSNVHDFVTAKSYGSIFRTLYTASYLPRELSEKALALLAVPDPYKILSEKLPSDVQVASKFGERTTLAADGSTIHQLHSCGIVYKKPNPYSVCIMTEGKSFDDLQSIINSLSLLIYDGQL